MDPIQVDANRRIDDLLRRNGVPQYRVDLLLGAGAVVRKHEDALTPLKKATDRVEEDDVVFVNDKNISYEDLVSIGTRLQIPADALQPRPKAGDGKPIAPILHIRGCEIGGVPPYMKKLKEALGGLQITAPKYYHTVASVKTPAG